jgi:hypothetical protein
MHRVDPNGRAREPRREAPEHTYLRAVGVDDVRPQPPAQAHELHQSEHVVPRVDRPADMLQLDVRRARGNRGVAQGSAALRGHRDLEPVGEPRKQERDSGLSAAELAQRDQDQQPGPAGLHHPGRYPPRRLGAV